MVKVKVRDMKILGFSWIFTKKMFSCYTWFVLLVIEPGGAKGSMFYSKRYSANSGLNSANLDFLPIQNIEEIVEVMGVGAVPVGKFIKGMHFLL